MWFSLRNIASDCSKCFLRYLTNSSKNVGKLSTTIPRNTDKIFQFISSSCMYFMAMHGVIYINHFYPLTGEHVC